MKKWIVTMLICAMLAMAFAALAEDTASSANAYVGQWQDPYYGRATMTILPCDHLDAKVYEYNFDIHMRWGSSASETSVWYMTAGYDSEADRLVYTDGVLADLTYAENGEIVSEENRWTDAEGWLQLNAEGALTWYDSREERSQEFAMQRITAPAPDPEEYAEKYFRVIARVESGTAGASLKQASAACDVLRFAADRRFWNMDPDEMRDNMLAGWESLTDEERQMFDENFMGIVYAIDRTLGVGNYFEYAGLFEDAGVGDVMSTLVEDDEAIYSWETLKANTLTMGNSED